MIDNRGYKYRLETTKLQKQLLFSHIFSHNQTWNILLNEKIKEFEQNSLNKKEFLNITTNKLYRQIKKLSVDII